MKYLHDYLNPMLTTLLSTHGAFYAFSEKQFEEQRKENIEYQVLGSGLIAPAKNAFRLAMDMDVKYKEAVERDIEENGVYAIVRRELFNYEAFHTMDIDETVEALKDYGIGYQQVRRIFRVELEKSSTI